MAIKFIYDYDPVRFLEFLWELVTNVHKLHKELGFAPSSIKLSERSDSNVISLGHFDFDAAYEVNLALRETANFLPSLDENYSRTLEDYCQLNNCHMTLFLKLRELLNNYKTINGNKTPIKESELLNDKAFAQLKSAVKKHRDFLTKIKFTSQYRDDNAEDRFDHSA